MSGDQQSDVPSRAPAEALIDQASREGWNFFDGPAPGAKPFDEASDRHKRIATLAAALWTTDAFRDVVGYLLEMSLHRVTFVSQLGMTLEQSTAYGVFREGQNSLAFVLLKIIAEGQQLSVKGRDP